MENKMNLSVGSIVEMRKSHPCGSNQWKIVRYGADVKLECLKCQRIVMVERIKLLKSIKKVIRE